MTTSPAPGADRDQGECRYWAFVSYAREDERWAASVHRSIERYRVPKPLVGRPAAGSPIPRSLRPVFRDRDELSTSSDLGKRLDDALRASRFLIVVCSPRAARSQWVNEEILRFKKLGREDRILCLIVDGDPEGETTAGSGNGCFPPALRFRVDENGALSATPAVALAADVRPGADPFRKALARLLAGMLGVEFDALWQRERRRRRMRLAMAAAAAVLAAGAATIAMLAIFGARADARVNELVGIVEKQRDPLTKALLLSTVPDDAESPARLGLLRRVAETPIPRAVFPRAVAAAFSPDETRVLIRERSRVLLWPASGKGDPLVIPATQAGADVEAAAFTPDGRLVVTGADDGRVAVWQAASGVLVWQSSDHRGPVRVLAVSRDGRVLVSGSQDRTARVWRLDRSGPPLVLAGHSGGIGAIAISPDGARIATGGGDIMDHSIRLWRADGRLDRVLRDHTGLVRMLAFDPEGGRLLSASDDETSRLWSMETGEVLSTFTGHEGPVWQARFSPDGRRVLTTSQKVRVWTLPGGKPIVLDPQGGWTRSATFSADGERVAAAADDGYVRVWALDEPSGSLVFDIGGPNAWSVAFDQRGARLLATGHEHGRLWHLGDGGEPIVIPLRSARRQAAALGAGGRHLATVGKEGVVEVYDTSRLSAGPIRTFEGVDATVGGDGDRLFVLAADGTVRSWPIGSNEAPAVAAAHRVQSRASFRKHGTLVVERNGASSLWRVDGREAPLGERYAGGSLEVATLGSTGPVLATASGDGVRVVTAGRVTHLPHDAPIHRMDLSSDGTRLVTVTDDTTVRVWLVDGARALTVKAVSAATDVAFDPTGRFVAVGSELGSIAMVAADGSGDPIVFRGHGEWIEDLAFSGDGSRLVSAANDGTFRVWRIRWRELLQFIRGATTMCLAPAERQALLAESAPTAQAAFEACQASHGRTQHTLFIE